MDKMISYTTIHRSHTLRKTLNWEGNKWHKVYGGCKNEISNKQELNWVVDVLSISPSKEISLYIQIEIGYHTLNSFQKLCY